MWMANKKKKSLKLFYKWPSILSSTTMTQTVSLAITWGNVCPRFFRWFSCLISFYSKDKTALTILNYTFNINCNSTPGLTCYVTGTTSLE